MNDMEQRDVIDFVGKKITRLIILLGLAFMVIPLIVTISLSLSQKFTFPPEGLTLEWYGTFFSTPAFIDGLRVSLVLGILTIMVSIAVGISLSLAIVRYSFVGKDLISNITLSPLTTPRIAMGMSIFLWFTFVGFQGSFARMLLVSQIIALAYVVRVVSASLYGFDRSLEEAAMNLGATPFQTFTDITFPLIKPGILVSAIFAFVATFNDIAGLIFFIEPGTTPYSVVVFSRMREYINPDVAAASAIPIFVTLLAMFFIERFIGLQKAMGIGATTQGG